jgi:uncharacterized protein (TIGR03083 family)
LTGKRAELDRLVTKVDATWRAFKESYAGLDEEQLLQPGVLDGWSVKDLIAHVTSWEEEALKHMPLIAQGGRPPRYVTYGGIDAFNAQTMEQKRGLALADVQRQLEETHARLLEYIRSAPVDQFSGETRSRRRLRLDTYGHIPQHTESIQVWRRQLG